MALVILASCINCDICPMECPNEAIFMGEDIYEIDADRCTECAGHYDQPQCVACCPIDCIAKDPNHTETQEQLLSKFESLRG